ncbi:hypothetical protein MTBLM5_450004 [Magnetospirillum sp. LM-5]|uniref:hypothetical protein n=1 Tax=Magnetospirillum sp. LM-5 TaxID=2681466 RepID=UPI0013847186|nr:hypothetical protein [Magnetospirillum sp. LM-5]CAA7622172.1 hypothetical protein MTBLM5_450004 [Magnetospirillum sp. LM-5]
MPLEPADIVLDQIFFRAGTKYPTPLRVTRIFTARDGVEHVQLSRSHSYRDTITVSMVTLLDPTFFVAAPKGK